MRLVTNEEMVKELKKEFEDYRNSEYPYLDPELTPVMNVVDSELFVPIYSCYGHEDSNVLSDRSYLMFVTPFPRIAINLHEFVIDKLQESSSLGTIDDKGTYVVNNEVNLSREVYYRELSTGEEIEYLAWNIEIKFSSGEFRDYVWELINTFLDSLKDK